MLHLDSRLMISHYSYKRLQPAMVLWSFLMTEEAAVVIGCFQQT